MPKVTYDKELEQFRDYLRSTDNEDAKRPLLYPLFQKLFKDKFRIESAAERADIYVEGKLIVESKTDHTQWLEGFYQALHYQRKYGLGYNTVMVVAREFVAIWKLKQLPEYAVIQYKTADVGLSPNEVGRTNARKTSKANKGLIRQAAYYWLDPHDLKGDIFQGAKNLLTESYEVLKILNNLDSDRVPITTHNFIDAIELFKPYFEHPIDAVHCFYNIVAYWDITSVVTEKPNGAICVTGFNGQRASDDFTIEPRHIHDFRKLIEGRYIFTNEGSGLTVDYYFSRFDEVLARIDPEYVKQHGIFFTSDNLSKFALWYAKECFPGRIDEDYIVFDPAGGSGNLISSWRGNLKHKIISELQPDLLRIIERRMNVDPFHLRTGFTIVPKTSEGKGLNFLDRSAAAYLDQLSKEVGIKGIKLDKPLAFLLNPPYKNTDENQKAREGVDAHYALDPGILELTGEDAGKERYLAFLGQILNIAKEQVRLQPDLRPMVMIFTPTSWLIPRPTYKSFRSEWDQHFRYHDGFIVTSNEWFKLQGQWPLAFTIWTYEPTQTKRHNTIEVLDLTGLQVKDLNIPWNAPDEEVESTVALLLSDKAKVTFTDSRGDTKAMLAQPMYDFKRDATKSELRSEVIYGGLATKDPRRSNKKTYGIATGWNIGFMDDVTPVRIKARNNDARFTALPVQAVWFRFDTAFIDINKSKCLSGPSDQKGYCAYNLESAQHTFSLFAMNKCLMLGYPSWANRLDMWPPSLKPERAPYWHSLCYAYALAENICVVTRFEANNPVEGAPEVFVENPLCPTNPHSFWSKVLDKEITGQPPLAMALVKKIKELYAYWNRTYTKGQHITSVGLHNEPYFRYFSYADFLTPHSGLIQIRKFAELNGKTDLLDLFAEVNILTKAVREELHRLLVHEFKYFA